MARTAPVPNFPAIPGMNPGIFLLGGGGDNGGSGAGGGKGKKKKQGAKGKNGGKDANGGGKGAGACGAGAGGGCMNPSHGGGGGTAAGDPVDPVTGRAYTIAQTDMVLTGPIVFSIQRSYSSYAIERDVGLGFGWSHSLAWEIETRRRTMTVYTPTGAVEVLPLPDLDGEVALANGALLRRDEDGFALALDGELTALFEPVGAAEPDRFQLASLVDRARNRIDLEYRGTQLDSLTDSAGRTVRVRRHGDGHIAGLELETSSGRQLSHRRYEYDAQGDLVAAIDAAGQVMRYSYEAHRLTDKAHPSGLCVHFRYDGAGRCVETWCDYPGREDAALDRDVPALLADGKTKAKGVMHCVLEYEDDATVLYDSRQTRRFDTNGFGKIDVASGVWTETVSYDEHGEVSAYADPSGATTRVERDERGRVLAEVDPSGARTEFKYDAWGNLAEAVDALGEACHYSYDEAGGLVEVRDAIGELLRCTNDARGLRTSATMPNGGTTVFTHDAEANLVEIVEPNGRARRMQHDEAGRVVAVTNEEGHVSRYSYDACGALRGVQLSNGAAASFDVDPDGHICRYVGPDGGVFELAWAGYNVVHEIRRPAGDVVRFRYDRECNLVRVINENGEEHRIERDAAGRIVAEKHFDGRAYSYRLDAVGRLALLKNGAGESTELDWNASGRVAKRSYENGHDAFEYDADGRLIHGETEATSCEFTYDARGNLVREAQTVAGRTVTIENGFDAAGNRVLLRASNGDEVRFERDAMSAMRRVHLPGGATIERTLDGLGREVLRGLPGGGQILQKFSSVGALIERSVAAPQRAQVAAASWVGALPANTVFAESYVHSPGGELLEHVDSTGARTQFEHDLSGRVLARKTPRGDLERYAHDGGGRLRELGLQAPERTYGPGGALLSRGGIDYAYDGEARRIARTDRESGLAQRYHWDSRGLLAAVTRADGTRVENVYDTSARRLLKRVIHPGGEVTETRFVWSGDHVVHESTEAVAGELRRTTHERSYVWDDDAGQLLAEREIRDGVAGPWLHHALGAGDLPSLLVGDDGNLLGRLRATVWGAVEAADGAATATPWRYAGQYCDSETGLSYNRYRFYDPEVGHYVNADPIGVSGGLNAFEYARGQPLHVVDPDGLAPPVKATVSGNGITGKGKSAGARNGDPELHPIVQQALPPTVTNAKGKEIYPRGDDQPPSNCAEPGALSDYIRKWEAKNNGGKPLDPNNPKDRNKIQKCLGDIKQIEAQHTDGTARAPCPNCSQMLSNLRSKWGAPKEKVVVPGPTSHKGTDSSKSSPASKDWLKGMRKKK